MGETIRAARGRRLRCRGWRQEGLLRLLENTLETAEKPEELIVYAGFARAARDWPSFHKIVEALLALADDETLVIQSGKPVATFRTHALGPRVVMANCNLVGRWATPETFWALERRGLIMWGGYTAGDWQYIGSQGIVQGTYETFAAAARMRWGTNLAGRLVVTAGLGGMGGAQPLAVVLAGGVALVAEVDPARIERRLATGYLQRRADTLEQALAWCLDAVQQHQPLSVGLVGNAAEVLPALLARGIQPDVVTDQTAAHDPLMGYIPVGLTVEQAADLRRRDPEQLRQRALATMATHVRAMREFQRRGAEVFEYGNNLRWHAHGQGVSDAFEIPMFMERYIRPLFCRGIGPFRWIALSGDARDIAAIDDLVLAEFRERPTLADWIGKARTHIQFQGLPARIAWLGHGERARLAVRVNELVARGDLAAPIAFTRDHLDAGAVAQPYRETEKLRDGTDMVADWPLLNALLNCAAMADLVALHGGGGGYAGLRQSAGITVIADGTPAGALRLERALTTDTGIGIVRYADAGYPEALAAAAATGVNLLMPAGDAESAPPAGEPARAAGEAPRLASADRAASERVSAPPEFGAG